jgi:hypothetical protein
MKRIIARVPGPRPGIEFNVVLVEVGDRYGLNDCLVHDGGGHGKEYREGVKVRPVEKPDAFVEFYDVRYNHTCYGQFVSRYFAKTLLGEPGSFGHKVEIGLCLQGDVPDWQVARGPMLVVRGAIAAATGRVALYHEKE